MSNWVCLETADSFYFHQCIAINVLQHLQLLQSWAEYMWLNWLQMFGIIMCFIFCGIRTNYQLNFHSCYRSLRAMVRWLSTPNTVRCCNFKEINEKTSASGSQRQGWQNRTNLRSTASKCTTFAVAVASATAASVGSNSACNLAQLKTKHSAKKNLQQ